MMEFTRRQFIGQTLLAGGHFALPQAADESSDLHRMIRPAPLTAKFEMPGYYVWCGTLTRGDDGSYYLLFSRWPHELGFSAWVTHSEIAVAVSRSPLGPFTFKAIALPARGKQFWDGLCTHNPTVLRFGKKYYLYHMGNTGDGIAMKTLNWTHRNNQRIGVAVADHPLGPWQRFDQPLIDTTPGFHDALMCSNPSVTRRPDRGYLMVYKAVGDKNQMPFGGPVVHCVATSDSPTGPFKKHPQPIFTKDGVAFPAEDPFVWHDGKRYRAIVKDNGGHFTNAGKGLVLFESADGFDWKLSAQPLLTTPEIAWANGVKQKLYSLERPQLWFENRKPAVLLGAADLSLAHEHSYNVQIPLKAR